MVFNERPIPPPPTSPGEPPGNELEKMEEVAQLCGLKTSTWLRALAMQLIRDGRGIVR